MLKSYQKEWFGNVRGDLLAGLVVSMALIPEVIGFSIVAGVDPMVGIYASFVISIITAIFGGRTGLISAAAGATALVLASLVQSHGIEYLFAATILTGVIQLALGFLKIGTLMKFIPKPVMTGFVNALGILMLKSQIDHFIGSPILIVLGVLGVAIIYGLPQLTRAVPSPIVSIVAITIIVNVAGIDITLLGDMGTMAGGLPTLSLPDVPFNVDTLLIVLPYAVSVALVGIVESLLTSQLVDEMTDTSSNKNRECIGQGLANVCSGLFGGIAGCGMIGQTITNQTYGGRGRLSTFTGGAIMFVAILALNDYVTRIPVVALAAVMVVISFTTFSWVSIRRIAIVPKCDTLVMLTTVAVVLATDNLAFGVVAGIVVSSVVFVIRHATIHVHLDEQGEEPTYHIDGQLFFASATDFTDAFDYQLEASRIHINFTHTRVWDESAVAAIDKVVLRYQKNGTEVHLVGLSESCLALVNRLALHDNANKGQ